MSQGFTSQLPVPLPVAQGGTGLTSTTAYAVLCGGTTSTGNLQSIAGVGTSGQVLTSNGAGALPTFQTLQQGNIGAWVNFNGLGAVAIRASGNVTSITDNGTGDYTVNITTALTDANYSAVGTCSLSSNDYSGSNVPYFSGPVATPTTTTYRLQTGQGAVGSQSGNIIDCTFISVQIVR